MYQRYVVQKQDFINRLAAQGYTKRDAETIIDDFIYVLEDAFANGEDVMFRGFGTFEIRNRNERATVGLDGKPTVIKAYQTVHFMPGKVLKRIVREGRVDGLTID